jgi:hypothetical protein
LIVSAACIDGVLLALAQEALDEIIASITQHSRERCVRTAKYLHVNPVGVLFVVRVGESVGVNHMPQE